jgi:hypothetical protein
MPTDEPLELEPADCQVPAGRIIVAADQVDTWGYRLVETTCDVEPVVIRVSDTWLRSIVRFDERRDGLVVEQVLGVECDMPVTGVREWSGSDDVEIVYGEC